MSGHGTPLGVRVRVVPISNDEAEENSIHAVKTNIRHSVNQVRVGSP